MVVCTLGDLVLDVIVQLERPLVLGDDVVASTRFGAGGQAANVAAWASALGESSRFLGKRGDDRVGRLVEEDLAGHGVELLGPMGGRTGVVISLVGADRDRSMASDRGSAQLSPAELDPSWFRSCAWLHISGYMLAATAGADACGQAAAMAREAGAQISLDTSSSTMIRSTGPDIFRARIGRVSPDVVFGTDGEFRALGGLWPAATSVVKHGVDGCSVVHGGRTEDLSAVLTETVDATGAGDAFAAGYLTGGVQRALAAGAKCVARVGAMP